jgi:hypothetical protein
MPALHLSEGRDKPSDFKLVLAETVQPALADAAIPEEFGEDEQEKGIAEIVFGVDLLSTSRQPVFHRPQFVRLFEPCGSLLGLPNDLVQFPLRVRSKTFRAMVLSSRDHLRSRPVAA